MTAQWTVPTVTCQPSLSADQSWSILILLGGYDSSTGYNTEILVGGGGFYCAQGSSSPTTISAGVDFLSANGGTWAGSGLPFLPISGHKISLTISTSPSTGKMTITLKDRTDGQSVSVTTPMSYWGIPYNYLYQAWWEVTAGPDLPQYTPAIKFTSCNVVVSGVTNPISSLNGVAVFQMVDGSNNPMATTSALNKAGNGFSVTYISST